MMKLIKTISLDSTAASITISNIPQEFKHLKLMASARSDFSAATVSLGLYINSEALDTSYRWFRGSGAVTASGNDSGRKDFYPGEANAASSTASTFTSVEIIIPNYNNSLQKTMLASAVSEQNGATAYQYFSVGLCTKTAPVTSIVFRCFEGTGNLVAGTTVYLYGIA